MLVVEVYVHEAAGAGAHPQDVRQNRSVVLGGDQRLHAELVAEECRRPARETLNAPCPERREGVAARRRVPPASLLGEGVGVGGGIRARDGRVRLLDPLAPKWPELRDSVETRDAAVDFVDKHEHRHRRLLGEAAPRVGILVREEVARKRAPVPEGILLRHHEQFHVLHVVRHSIAVHAEVAPCDASRDEEVGREVDALADARGHQRVEPVDGVPRERAGFRPRGTCRLPRGEGLRPSVVVVVDANRVVAEAYETVRQPLDFVVRETECRVAEVDAVEPRRDSGTALELGVAVPREETAVPARRGVAQDDRREVERATRLDVGFVLDPDPVRTFLDGVDGRGRLRPAFDAKTAEENEGDRKNPQGRSCHWRRSATTSRRVLSRRCIRSGGSRPRSRTASPGRSPCR